MVIGAEYRRLSSLMVEFSREKVTTFVMPAKWKNIEKYFSQMPYFDSFFIIIIILLYLTKSYFLSTKNAILSNVE